MPRIPRVFVCRIKKGGKFVRGVARLRWRELGQVQSETVRGARAIANRKRQLEERIRRHAPVPRGAVLPLAELVDRFIEARMSEGRLGEGSAHEYRREFKVILEQTKWKWPSQVTQLELVRWRKLRGGRNVAAPFRYLKALIRWASNPIIGQTFPPLDLTTPKPPKRAKRPLYTIEQAETLRARIVTAGQLPLCHCIATYGWRPSACAKLLISDLHLDESPARAILRAGKNKDDLEAVLLPATVELLRQAIGKRATGPVFLTPHGNPWSLDKKGSAHWMSYWFITDVAYDMPHDAGVKQRGIYNLKRLGMTRLLVAAGGDAAATAGVSGHRSKVQVLTYNETNRERQLAVLEAVQAFGVPPTPAARAGDKPGRPSPSAHPTEPELPAMPPAARALAPGAGAGGTHGTATRRRGASHSRGGASRPARSRSPGRGDDAVSR